MLLLPAPLELLLPSLPPLLLPRVIAAFQSGLKVRSKIIRPWSVIAERLFLFLGLLWSTAWNDTATTKQKHCRAVEAQNQTAFAVAAYPPSGGIAMAASTAAVRSSRAETRAWVLLLCFEAATEATATNEERLHLKESRHRVTFRGNCSRSAGRTHLQGTSHGVEHLRRGRSSNFGPQVRDLRALVTAAVEEVRFLWGWKWHSAFKSCCRGRVSLGGVSRVLSSKQYSGHRICPTCRTWAAIRLRISWKTRSA